MKYFIIPQSEIETLLPAMKTSFGHENVSVRMSLDGTKGLMQFNEENAPEGYTGHDTATIKTLLDTDEWTEEAEPLADEDRIAIMMEYGKKIVIEFQAENSKMIDEGIITEAETLALLNDVDVQAVTTALLSGTLKSALYLISSRFLDAQGQPTKSWLSQERAMKYITQIQSILASL